MKPTVGLWLCGIVATAALVCGCGDGGSVGSFAFAASSHVDVPADGSGTIHIRLVPSADFHDSVHVTVVSPPDGLTAEPLSIPADSPSGDLVLHVAAGPARDASLTIQGESPGGVRATATVTVSAGLSGGLLDPAFGDDGISQSLLSVSLPDEHCGTVATQPDGKILVALLNVFQPGRLVRVNDDGTPDMGFGKDGQASLTGHSGMGTTPLAMAFTPDRKILILGYESLPPGSAKPMLWRFSSDGSPDASLGVGGFVSLSTVASSIGALATRADGGLDLIGGSAGVVTSARLTADGQLDPTYGEGGTTSFPADGRAQSYVHLAEGGWVVSLLNGSPLAPSSTIVQVTSSGAEGQAATAGGEICSNLHVVGDDYLDVAIQLTPGKLMASLERRRSDLTLDPSFGTAGSVPVQALVAVFASITSSDGTSLLFGDDGVATPLAKIARLSADGSLDAGFRIAGTATVASLLGAEPNANACSSPFAVDTTGRVAFATLDAREGLRLLRFLP